MLDITKIKTESGYHFTLNNGEQKLSILFAGNLDLYWAIDSKDFVPITDDVPTKTFEITKENYHIYSLFDKLYNDIKNCNVFVLKDYELEFCETEEEKQQLIFQNKKMNDSFKRTEVYKSLFHDNVIEWRSDEVPFDEASFVTIEKRDEAYAVTFNKSEETDFSFQTYSIRFSNSGSRYDSFCGIFMRMYLELIDYEPDYHQTHIEEYLWQKKLIKKPLLGETEKQAE